MKLPLRHLSLFSLTLIFLSFSCNINPDNTMYIDDLKGSCIKTIEIGNSSGTVIDSECLVGKKVRYLKGEFLNGEKYDINNSTTRCKVINRWFAQCKPCIAEIPGLNRLYDKYSSRVDFISLCRNDVKDDMHVIKKYNFKFSHLTNSHLHIDDWFPGTGYPTTYIVDQNNIVIDVIIGGKPDMLASIEIYNEISEVLERLIVE